MDEYVVVMPSALLPSGAAGLATPFSPVVLHSVSPQSRDSLGRGRLLRSSSAPDAHGASLMWNLEQLCALPQLPVEAHKTGLSELIEWIWLGPWEVAVLAFCLQDSERQAKLGMLCWPDASHLSLTLRAGAELAPSKFSA